MFNRYNLGFSSLYTESPPDPSSSIYTLGTAPIVEEIAKTRTSFSLTQSSSVG